MPNADTPTATRREKLDAVLAVFTYRPKLTWLIVVLGFCAAVLEGLGLSFILPIIELVQSGGRPESSIAKAFASVFRTLGVPLTLGTAVVGVALVMTLRYALSFAVAWLREVLRASYIRHLQVAAFTNAFDAEIAYFDEEGSDDAINAIVTQATQAGHLIERLVLLIEQSLLALVYGLIALVISPTLTVVTGVVLGGATLLLRRVLDSGYDVGDEVADANERRHEAAQAGTQGMRDIRIFGIADELLADVVDAVDTYTWARVRLRRNEAAITNFHQWTVAVSVFVLIYVSLTFVELSLGYLGLFLFAMFRLGPKVSRANELYYKVENRLPHLVRTQAFIRELDRRTEPQGASRPVPDAVDSVAFDDVHFSYDGETEVLRGIDFAADRGEFIAFVGKSGAGKSTIVSLLSRMREPTEGAILANGEPIDEMAVDDWRERIAVVRQDPFIFNETLRYNLTIADRDADQADLDRICSIARVDEFVDDLPNGYDTHVGDEGVRLSGGQQQRVALARALLDDVDVLILDEATSDLDSNLEREVQAGIESMDDDYVVVTIAHRLSTVKNADRIYTLESGHIAEAGTHDELVANDGTYADLYKIQ
jgi:subfamily B ATP-binding cassette protein MsbA